MSNEQLRNSFLKSAAEWVCDDYSATIRFIAGVDQQRINIWEAAIGLSPLPPEVDNSFTIKSDKIFVGQIDINLATKRDLMRLLETAIQGAIETPQGTLELAKENRYSYYSERIDRERWFYQLDLAVHGTREQPSPSYELAEIDNQLRLSTPPFDGISDAAAWLDLTTNTYGNNNSSISIRINPPVDLVFDQCSLNDDEFRITLHAHPLFNSELLRLAIRGAPGNGLQSRLQIAQDIAWESVDNKLLIGTGSVTVPDSDSAIAVLMIGTSIVRRHWFIDPNKARNNRLIAVQSFDKNLKMVKQAVLETAESSRFETGIAALLFLLGFSPCVQVETDSPDLIVQTPGGRIILVECTLRISDFSAKIGKLVDRRGALSRTLEKSGHAASIVSALVCRLPRDRIATHANDLRSHKTILITQEQLAEAFEQVRYHNDPDKILDEAEAALNVGSQVSPIIGG